MPTIKPRINLTVEPEMNKLLEDISRLTHKPKASFIVDMLKDSEPLLVELIEALESVERSKSALPNLYRMASMANSKVSVINSEMAKESDKASKND